MVFQNNILFTNLQKKTKGDIFLNINDNYKNNQNNETCLGIDNNSFDISVSKTENDKNNILTNDKKNKHNNTSWEEQVKNNDVETIENNNFEKKLDLKENNGKVETANDDIERSVSKCRTELKITDNKLQNNNNQVECNIKASNEASYFKIENDNTNCDKDEREPLDNAYVELNRDINGNSHKDSLSTDLNKKNNSAQDTNSSEESSDSDESNETSDCSIYKLDKRYKQSIKSKTNNKNNARKQDSTKRNSTNDVNKMNKESRSNIIANNEKCDICGQFLNDPELLYYQGHPQDAVEEYVALTDDKLVLIAGKLVAHLEFYIKVFVLLRNLVSQSTRIVMLVSYHGITCVSHVPANLIFAVFYI